VADPHSHRNLEGWKKLREEGAFSSRRDFLTNSGESCKIQNHYRYKIGIRSLRYPDACFDQIFTKGLGKPISSVVQAKGSDHLPVIMEVAIPSRQRRSESTQTKSPVLVGTGLA
jgi:hypothetical protein